MGRAGLEGSSRSRNSLETQTNRTSQAAIALPKKAIVTGRVTVARLRVHRSLDPCSPAATATRHRIR